MDYWILAYPAKHSLSPLMQTAAFRHYGMKDEYWIFEVEPERLPEFMSDFVCQWIKWCSVSMPYKVTIMDYLESIDWVALEIWAVNTVYRQWDMLCWANTDYYGLLKVFENISKNSKVAIIWAWGAASSWVYAMKQLNNEVTIFNRTRDKARKIANKFWVCYWGLDEFIIDDFDLIMNFTSVWMDNPQDSPVEGDFRADQIFFESIYAHETALSRRAKTAWAQVITWIEMLLYQGAKQFEIWTWREAPIDVMRKALLHYKDL